MGWGGVGRRAERLEHSGGSRGPAPGGKADSSPFSGPRRVFNGRDDRGTAAPAWALVPGRQAPAGSKSQPTGRSMHDSVHAASTALLGAPLAGPLPKAALPSWCASILTISIRPPRKGVTRSGPGTSLPSLRLLQQSWAARGSASQRPPQEPLAQQIKRPGNPTPPLLHSSGAGLPCAGGHPTRGCCPPSSWRNTACAAAAFWPFMQSAAA